MTDHFSTCPFDHESCRDETCDCWCHTADNGQPEPPADAPIVPNRTPEGTG